LLVALHPIALLLLLPLLLMMLSDETNEMSRTLVPPSGLGDVRVLCAPSSLKLRRLKSARATRSESYVRKGVKYGAATKVFEDKSERSVINIRSAL